MNFANLVKEVRDAKIAYESAEQDCEEFRDQYDKALDEKYESRDRRSAEFHIVKNNLLAAAYHAMYGKVIRDGFLKQVRPLVESLIIEPAPTDAEVDAYVLQLVKFFEAQVGADGGFYVDYPIDIKGLETSSQKREYIFDFLSDLCPIRTVPNSYPRINLPYFLRLDDYDEISPVG